MTKKPDGKRGDGLVTGHICLRGRSGEESLAGISDEVGSHDPISLFKAAQGVCDGDERCTDDGRFEER